MQGGGLNGEFGDPTSNVRAILEAFKCARSTRPNALWEGPLRLGMVVGGMWGRLLALERHLPSWVPRGLQLGRATQPDRPFGKKELVSFFREACRVASGHAVLARRPPQRAARRHHRPRPSSWAPPSAHRRRRAARRASRAPCQTCPTRQARMMLAALVRHSDVLNCSSHVAAAQPPLAEPLVAVVLVVAMLIAARAARSLTRPPLLLLHNSRLSSSRTLIARGSSACVAAAQPPVSRGWPAARGARSWPSARRTWNVHVAKSARPKGARKQLRSIW